MAFGWLKTEKALLNWLVNNVLRRKGWNNHPTKMLFTQRARQKLPIGKNGRMVFGIKCEHCRKDFRETDVQVNHKVNCIQNGISWEELSGICKRMFCVTENDLEHLCKNCHDIVTYSERYNCTKEEAKIEKKVIKFADLSAKEQKAKLIRAGIEPAKNQTERKAQVREYLNAKRKAK